MRNIPKREKSGHPGLLLMCLKADVLKLAKINSKLDKEMYRFSPLAFLIRRMNYESTGLIVKVFFFVCNMIFLGLQTFVQK